MYLNPDEVAICREALRIKKRDPYEDDLLRRLDDAYAIDRRGEELRRKEHVSKKINTGTPAVRHGGGHAA